MTDRDAGAGAGAGQDCSECGHYIWTPARPIGKVGVVIDLDQHQRDVEQHYAEKHPGVPVPERLW